MRFQDQGEPDLWHDPRGPVLSRFPGLVAIAEERIGSGTPQLVLEQNDEEPWAVEIGYQTSTGRLLAVRTVRSWKHLNPRGLPVEDLPGAVVNFQLKAASSPSHAGQPAMGTQAWLTGRAQGIRLGRAELGKLPVASTQVVMDDVEITGTRIEVPGCAAVQLDWGEQTVFCAGEAETLNVLRLRSASPEDLTDLLS
jgi:hypothetical protein